MFRNKNRTGLDRFNKICYLIKSGLGKNLNDDNIAHSINQEEASMEKATLQEMGKRYPRVGPMLNIMFKRDGVIGLTLLWNLAKNGCLRFADEMIVSAILTSGGDWQGDRNRVVGVYSPMGNIFQNPIFIERISRDIESIRLASAHPFNVLMTGRKKVQEESTAEIVHDCLNGLGELKEFELSLSGKFEVFCGLPQITFELKAASETVAIVILDGWSGQMLVNGVPQGIAYSDPKEFHDIVRELAYKYMDELTAPPTPAK